jgi:hypothetical protein
LCFDLALRINNHYIMDALAVNKQP